MDCPAFGKRCNKCQRLNHFAAVCKAYEPSPASYMYNTTKKDRQQGQRGKKNVKKASGYESDSQKSSDEDFITQSIAHMTIKKDQKRYSLEKTVPLMINDISIRADPDSGADVNVMDEYQFRALKFRSSTELILHKTETAKNFTK